MTGKKLFVLGDSYSHHDGVPYDTSWPAVLTDIDPTITVVNGSVPGSSLDSLFYRYLELERAFGKPDMLLVLLTYPWRMWYMTDSDPVLEIEQIGSRYHVAVGHKLTYIVPIDFGNRPREQRLERVTGHSIKDLKTLFKLQSDPHHQWWRLLKEVHILNAYFDNTVFMSWTQDYSDWLTPIGVNYLGTVADMLGDRFTKCAKSVEDEHFSIAGHAELAPKVYEKIKDYLPK
jgi:hypothetical protein